jgi:hypothetical protein
MTACALDGGEGLSLVKGLQMTLKAIALSIKPGGALNELHSAVRSARPVTTSCPFSSPTGSAAGTFVAESWPKAMGPTACTTPATAAPPPPV